jgi:hypothetical protein
MPPQRKRNDNILMCVSTLLPLKEYLTFSETSYLIDNNVIKNHTGNNAQIYHICALF